MRSETSRFEATCATPASAPGRPGARAPPASGPALPAGGGGSTMAFAEHDATRGVSLSMPRQRHDLPPVECLSILDADGRVDQALEPTIPPEEFIRLYRTFLLARRFDERMLSLQRQGRIGTYLPTRGHEAAELRSHRECFDRLPVRAGRGVEALERVPRGEQRRGEQQRPPDPDLPVAVDSAVADVHEHP